MKGSEAYAEPAREACVGASFGARATVKHGDTAMGAGAADTAKARPSTQGVADTASVHRCAIDPRVVLLQVLCAGACGFVLNSVISSTVASAFIVALLACLGCRRAALMLLAWAALINAVCAIIQLVPSWGVLGIFAPAFFVARKVVPVAGAAIVFWNGLTVSRLIAVLTQWRLPKGLVLTLAVAFRFMPTISVEVGAIRDALTMRGRPLTFASVIRHPREMCECVLVPLLMRCTRVADELSASATTRAIENPAPRSSRYDLRMRAQDWAMLAATVVAVAVVVLLEFGQVAL